MTAKEQFRAAFGGVRALHGLPSQTSELASNWYGYAPIAKKVLAYLALADLPKPIVEAAHCAYSDQFDRQPQKPMRSARQLAYYTPAAIAKRKEAHRLAIVASEHCNGYHYSWSPDCSRCKAEAQQQAGGET